MSNLALLILRLVTGGLMAGHGAQKAFGSFGGHGFKGTAGWLESMGLRPGHMWAGMAATGEFGGGMLTLLGLGGPIGSFLSIGSMLMATGKAHWGKPIWVTSGGAELPVTYMAASTALAIAGPGTYSLDRLFGIRVPKWLSALVLLGTLGTVAYGLMVELEAPDEPAEQPRAQRQEAPRPTTQQTGPTQQARPAHADDHPIVDHREASFEEAAAEPAGRPTI